MDNRKWNEIPNQARLEMAQIQENNLRIATLHLDLNKLINQFRTNEITMHQLRSKFIEIQKQIEEISGGME